MTVNVMSQLVFNAHVTTGRFDSCKELDSKQMNGIFFRSAADSQPKVTRKKDKAEERKTHKPAEMKANSSSDGITHLQRGSRPCFHHCKLMLYKNKDSF